MQFYNIVNKSIIILYIFLFGLFLVQYKKNKTEIRNKTKINFLFVLRHFIFCIVFLFLYSFIIYLLFDLIKSTTIGQSPNLFNSVKLILIPIIIYLYFYLCMNHWFSKKQSNKENLKKSINSNKYIQEIPKSYKKYNSIFLEDNLDFTIIKTETTGIRDDAKLVEFAAIKIRNGKPVKSFNTLINPKIKIPNEAIKIHGINNRKVNKAPTVEGISQLIYDFIEDDIVVGHNIDFDIMILKNNLKNGFVNKNIDIITTIKQDYKLRDYKLKTIIDKLDLIEIITHRALHDAFIIMKCIQKLNEEKRIY